MRLLTPPANQTKMAKTLGRGVYTSILHLAPHNLSGYNVCPWATAGCSAACLNTAGRGHMPGVQRARIERTHMFHTRHDEFMAQLVGEVEAHERAAKSKGMIPAVRLNGTSDLRWEAIFPFDLFPEVKFYDYTKFPPHKRGVLPPNYKLTFSLSEHKNSVDNARKALVYGWNVAVVYDFIPNYCDARFNPCADPEAVYTVFNGDEDDARFLQNGLVIGLKAKGKAKKDDTGFVRRS